MAKKLNIKKAIKKPGALRKQMGVKKGKNIPKTDLEQAAHKKGKLGARARFALLLAGFSKGKKKGKKK